MTKVSQLIAGALLCLAAVPASAQVHTYVSGKGADTGGCATPATACRTFAFAIARTTTSGTIIAIDPANYGPVTITKSISIVADGAGPAGIFINAGTAIDINVGANDIVNLRGLTLDGAGTASEDISSTAVSSLEPPRRSVTITDCFIRHFNGTGIFLALGKFLISNTVSSDNMGAGLSIGFNSTAVVDHFTASGDNMGITMGSRSAPTDVTIVDSVMANNASDGLVLTSLPSNNTHARLAGSVVTKNGIGVNTGAGSVGSYGDNEINGNGTDIQAFPGTFTTLAKR